MMEGFSNAPASRSWVACTSVRMHSHRAGRVAAMGQLVLLESPNGKHTHSLKSDVPQSLPSKDSV